MIANFITIIDLYNKIYKITSHTYTLYSFDMKNTYNFDKQKIITEKKVQVNIVGGSKNKKYQNLKNKKSK